jgi:hypothetical protein
MLAAQQIRDSKHLTQAIPDLPEIPKLALLSRASQVRILPGAPLLSPGFVGSELSAARFKVGNGVLGQYEGPRPPGRGRRRRRSGGRRTSDPYRSRVMVADLWPSICCTTLTSAPAAMARLAAVCRRPCGTRPALDCASPGRRIAAQLEGSSESHVHAGVAELALCSHKLAPFKD